MANATASIMEQEKKELTAAADEKQSEIEKQAEEAIKKAEAEKVKAEKEAKEAKTAAEKAKAEQKAAEAKAAEEKAKAEAEANRRAQEEARRREQEQKDVYSVEPMNKNMVSTTDNLKFRQWATTNSDVLAVLNKGDMVHVIGAVKCNGQYTSWYKAERNGMTGYVCGDWLANAEEHKDVYSVEPMNKDMSSTTNDLKLRQWETTDSDILTVLNYGDIVKVIGAVKCNGQYTGWYKVDRDGIVGYCCGDWLTDIKEAAETPYTVFDTTYYLALRNAPATDDANEIGQLHNGDTFYVTDRSNGAFYYGHTADGQWGYVNANYIAI